MIHINTYDSEIMHGKVKLSKSILISLEADEDRSVIISVIPHKCIVLMPFSKWKIIESETSQTPITNPEIRRMIRTMFYFSVKSEISLDDYITIPTNHFNHCNIDKEITVLNMIDKIEIWDKTSFINYVNDNNQCNTLDLHRDDSGRDLLSGLNIITRTLS